MLPAVFAFRFIHSVTKRHDIGARTIGFFRISFPGESADTFIECVVGNHPACRYMRYTYMYGGGFVLTHWSSTIAPVKTSFHFLASLQSAVVSLAYSK